MKTAALLIPLLLVTTVARAENTVRALLVPSTFSAMPGNSFDVAIHFTIPSGWHMYWLNPGQTGAPPKVKWDLPAGVTAGPLRFPMPHRIDLPEHLVAYGYDKDFALLTTVSIDRNFDAERPIDLQASVDWVVCSDECKFEKQSVATSINIGRLTPINADQFAGWRNEQPRRLGGSDPRINVSIGKPKGRGVISIAMPHDFESATDIEMFPPPVDFITLDEGASLHAIVDGMMVTQPFRIEAGEHPDVNSIAVMFYTDGKKKRQSIELPFVVTFNRH